MPPIDIRLFKDATAMVVAVILAVWAIPAPAQAQAGPDGAWSLTGYGFWLTDNNWRAALWPGSVEFIDAGAVALAAGRRVGTVWDDRIALEVEGVVARHVGDQDHWELAAAPVARWQPFPWDDTVDTSLSWGIGLSWASEKPATEVARSDSTQQLMIYWILEATAGPPGADWEASFRLHHRSGGYGLIADEGGSNALGVGLKWRF